jgi:predicted MFS family arabinose efflux permease
VLFVVLAFVLAHNILYTYIAPFLMRAGMAERTDVVLLVFGMTSLFSIWVVGVLIDRYLRALTLASTVLFGLAAWLLGMAGGDPIAVYAAVVMWGVAFGGRRPCFRPRWRGVRARLPIWHSPCWLPPGMRRLPAAELLAACCWRVSA